MNCRKVQVMGMRSMGSITITHMYVVIYSSQVIVKKVYKSLPNYWVLVIDLLLR